MATHSFGITPEDRRPADHDPAIALLRFERPFGRGVLTTVRRRLDFLHPLDTLLFGHLPPASDIPQRSVASGTNTVFDRTDVDTGTRDHPVAYRLSTGFYHSITAAASVVPAPHDRLALLYMCGHGTVCRPIRSSSSVAMPPG